MDQDLAKKLFFDGAIFLFLDVPKGTEFGIDMKIWNTDEDFRGIKMIPAGLHFVHYSAISKTGEQSPRSGFFHIFNKGELVVKRFNKQTEDICTEHIGDIEIGNLKKNIMNYEKFLGPYPYDIKEKWESLTNHISDYLVKDLAPESGFVRSALILVSLNDTDRLRASPNSCSGSKRKRRSRSNEDDLLPDLKPVPGTELRFTKFPELNFPEGSSPAEITKHSLDSTYVLETMIKKHKNLSDFIGEIQFSFICFLVGHSLEAFEHWKSLVGLVCSCDIAITKYRIIYDLFATVLEIQLQEIPEEFLADIVANNNFVYQKLRQLFRTVQESNTDGILKTKMARFRDSLSQKFLWDFSNNYDDPDDEAPVVVEL